MGETYSAHEEDEKCIHFDGKPEGENPFRRPRSRREDNIKMYLKNREGGCELDSCGSRQGPVAGSCEDGNETLGSIKGGRFLTYLRILLGSQGLCSVESVMFLDTRRKDLYFHS
jgi:hypothetical protein